jgi:DNA gyrase subunit A
MKRVTLEEFSSVRRSGLIAVNLDEGDELGWARLTVDQDEVMLITRRGLALRFNVEQIRVMGRQAAGVTGIKLRRGDVVSSMDIVEPDGSLLVVTCNGYAKRSDLNEYPVRNRATQGVQTIDKKALNIVGEIASARVVQDPDQITVISTNGVVMRTGVKNVRVSGRTTRGVRLMNLDEGDTVATVARFAESDLRKAEAADTNESSGE